MLNLRDQISLIAIVNPSVSISFQESTDPTVLLSFKRTSTFLRTLNQAFCCCFRRKDFVREKFVDQAENVLVVLYIAFTLTSSLRDLLFVNRRPVNNASFFEFLSKKKKSTKELKNTFMIVFFAIPSRNYSTSFLEKHMEKIISGVQSEEKGNDTLRKDISCCPADNQISSSFVVSHTEKVDPVSYFCNF